MGSLILSVIDRRESPPGAAAHAACSVIEGLAALLPSYPSLKPGIALCSFVFDALREQGKRSIEQVAALHRQGLLEILLLPAYRPAPALVRADEAAEHIEHNRADWMRFGVSQMHGIWLPDGPELLPLLALCSCRSIDYAVYAGTDGRSAIAGEHHPNFPAGIFPAQRIGAEAVRPLVPEQSFFYCDLLFDTEGLLESPARGLVLLERALEAVAARPSSAPFLSAGASSASIAGAQTVPTGTAAAQDQEPRFCPALNRLSLRLDEMRGHLARLPDHIQNNALQAQNTKRLATARNWFLQAQHLLPASPHGVRSLNSSFAALLRAQVEADAILHPETDPADGWIELGKTDVSAVREFVVDNPFLRLYFEASAGSPLVEVDYKPRKVNFLNPAVAGGRSLFSAQLIPPDGCSAGPKRCVSDDAQILRRNPDVAVIRFCEELHHSGAVLVKDFTFRSGLGAHQANSTTGFNLEFWIESAGQPREGALLALHCPLVLPSCDTAVVLARPLLCAGGEAEHTLPAAAASRVMNQDVPGGPVRAAFD